MFVHWEDLRHVFKNLSIKYISHQNPIGVFNGNGEAGFVILTKKSEEPRPAQLSTEHSEEASPGEASRLLTDNDCYCRCVHS